MGYYEDLFFSNDSLADRRALDGICEFCRANNIWNIPSRNQISHHFEHAPILARHRLGRHGIPQHDELKTRLGYFSDVCGRKKYFAVHLRGGSFMDEQKIKAHLNINGDVAWIVPEHGESGQVNPFTLAFGYDGKGIRSEPVLQIFDRAVLESYGLPETMMSSAGSQLFAIEFRPQELIKALGFLAEVADIAIPPSSAPPRRIGIGIVTGNSPDSGALLWRTVNDKVRRKLAEGLFLGDLSYPPVTVSSTPGLGLSMELDLRHEQVWEHLKEAVTDLRRSGVKLIALACHTNHYFTDRIRQVASDYDVKFISMPNVVEDWVRAQSIKDLTLIGIHSVANLGQWSAYRGLSKLTNVHPLSKNGLNRIQNLAYLVKLNGPTKQGRDRWQAILKEEVKTQHVVIALTEISILLASPRRKGASGRIITDALELYGEAIADAYLKLAHPSGL